MRAQLRVLVPGTAAAETIALAAPLSLWGGFDPATGLIIDRNHPDCGASLSGRIVMMPYARGSSSSSSTLLESVRTGKCPAAFLLSRSDPILVIGALVAADLYARQVPILVVEKEWAAVTRARFASFTALLNDQRCVAELRHHKNSD